MAVDCRAPGLASPASEVVFTVQEAFAQRRHEMDDVPVSQICAFTVFPSIFSDRVANSTPIVDFDSKLNSLRVNRESTVGA